MGLRSKVREKLSTATLRRKSIIDNTDATSTKTTPLSRVRTNSNASIPEHLRHTRSIPASLKTILTGHSRANTETSTLGLGHRASTVGAASTIGDTRGSSLETESTYPAATPAEEKTEAAAAAVPGKVTAAGPSAASDVRDADAGESVEKPQVYPQSKGKFSEGSLEVEQPKSTQAVVTAPVDTQPVKQTVEVPRPVIDGPIRSQPQEEHSYPRGGKPSVPIRRASTKAAPAQSEERSRGLDLEDKVPSPSTGFRMKMKLAWMGLKSKAKL